MNSFPTLGNRVPCFPAASDRSLGWDGAISVFSSRVGDLRLSGFVLCFLNSEFPLLFLLILKCKIFYFLSPNRKTISLFLFQQIDDRANNNIFSFDYDTGFGWKKAWLPNRQAWEPLFLLWWNNREEIELAEGLAKLNFTIF